MTDAIRTYLDNAEAANISLKVAMLHLVNVFDLSPEEAGRTVALWTQEDRK